MDRDADYLNDLHDIETRKPGLINATVEWFRKYKIPEGKPENQFAFDGKAKGAALAQKIVGQVHKNWETMMIEDYTRHEIDRSCTRCGFRSHISSKDAMKTLDGQPEFNNQNKPPSFTTAYNYCESK